MWYYRNKEKELVANRFKKKLKFHSKSSIFSYSNLTKEERQAIYSLRDDTSVLKKLIKALGSWPGTEATN